MVSTFDEPIYPWYDLAHQASIRAGIATPDHEPTSWAPHETYGCTLEEWVKVLDDEVLNPEGMYRQPFKEGVIEIINRMYHRGYGIHIITARGSFGDLGDKVRRITRSEIIKQGLHYTTLTFSKDKVPVAKDLDLDYMLDDAPHNVQPLLDAGINTYLLTERWNIDMDIDPARRVDSTFEFCKMIMDKHGLQYPARKPQKPWPTDPGFEFA